MAEISAADVMKLREKTGVGMMECKKALVDTGGDLEAAVKLLREKGAAKAEKRMGRSTSEGIVHAYIHGGGRIGVLIEVNCETDFVARTDQFKALVNDLAMQVAANPQIRSVSHEDLPESLIEAEKDIYRKQAEASGKPAAVIEKMVDGRIAKYYEEVCLLDQPFIKDDKKKISDLVKEAIVATGENISVRRFARFQLGEEA
ncbi:MAG: translation elongation factor Ts [Candidatus Omnitrophica bacterium]|nr:translation elongation factor Ts [bacterium]MBK7494684.1 translation elongation factor Ts [Candidatus Omnitrophota bacterium]MCE7909125.1 translation elongation factor Ts [Candidatus Omnitrophica bacterium COP1]MBV6480956.1 Elongation factor Ts [bacterium]MCC6731707.1 translation elongation factor Ts [Candidatus Omnitrophota bacterium]